MEREKGMTGEERGREGGREVSIKQTHSNHYTCALYQTHIVTYRRLVITQASIALTTGTDVDVLMPTHPIH